MKQYKIINTAAASLVSLAVFAGCGDDHGAITPTVTIPGLSGMLVYSQYTTVSESGESDILIYDFKNNRLGKPSSTWGIKNPVNAVFSSDGEYIAFMAQGGNTSSWDIYLYSVTEGGQPENLTLRGHARDKYPRFSPDGGSIVFTSDGQLAVITLSTGGIEVLTADADADYAMPCYNSSGDKILYVKGSGAQSSIGVYDVAAKSGQTLYAATGLPVSYPVSVDAQSFFFNTTVSATNNREQVYKGFFNGQPAEKMAFNTDKAAYADASYAGSGYVVMSNTRSGSAGGYDLYVLDVAGDAYHNMNDYLRGVNSAGQERFGSYNPNNVTVSEVPGDGGVLEKPGVIIVETSSIAFTSTAGQKTLAVTSNVDEWIVSVKAGDEDWCTAVKTETDGKYAVAVSVKDNEDTVDRNTEVYIVFGGTRVTVGITQYGKVDPTKTFNICGDTGTRPLDTYDEFHADGRPKLYGKLIFHNYSSYGTTNPSTCWEYDFWTGKLTNLSSGWNSLTVNPMNVHWAPNGKHICFMGYSSGWKIFLWDLARELPVMISTANDSRGEDPKFSYDSKKVVWKRSGVLYEYDIESESVTRLTPSELGSDFHIPYYLPDDDRIVYCADATGSESIWVYDKAEQTKEKVADLVGVDYYPIGRDGESFYFSAHTRDNLTTVAADQLWMGFYDKSTPKMFPWNSQNSDTSDACYVNQDWVMVCSTRRVTGVSKGGYDYYIAKVNNAAANNIWNLNLYCDAQNLINTNLEELGASYLPSRLMYNGGEWVETAPGTYWNSPKQ